MKQSSSKSLEKKLARKTADLDAAMESRQQIDGKIKELREEIETLQATQLEQVFQQVKKSTTTETICPKKRSMRRLHRLTTAAGCHNLRADV